MDQSRPPLEHRQKRWTLWARLWLARVVRFLALFANAPMPDAMRAWFDSVLGMLTKVVMCLVLIRAGQLLQPVRMRNARQIILARQRHDVREKEHAGARRAATGAHLRRAVRVSGAARFDFQKRAEKLLRVLEALEDFAARIVRRGRNGLSRLRALHTGIMLPLPLKAFSPPLQRAGSARIAVRGAELRAGAPP